MVTFLNNEIWVNIKNHDDYQISNFGRIKSFKNGKEKLLKPWVANTGYLTIGLDNKSHSIHRLVAETFIHKIANKKFVNHIDGNKLNNSISNLEWCSLAENIQHAFKTGLMDNAIKIMASKKIRAKIIKQYNLAGEYIRSYKGSVEAQNYLRKQNIRVNARNIRHVCE